MCTVTTCIRCTPAICIKRPATDAFLKQKWPASKLQTIHPWPRERSQLWTQRTRIWPKLECEKHRFSRWRPTASNEDHLTISKLHKWCQGDASDPSDVSRMISHILRALQQQLPSHQCKSPAIVIIVTPWKISHVRVLMKTGERGELGQSEKNCHVSRVLTYKAHYSSKTTEKRMQKPSGSSRPAPVLISLRYASLHQIPLYPQIKLVRLQHCDIRNRCAVVVS